MKTFQSTIQFIALTLTLIAAPLAAQQYEEGTHYERISAPDVADSDGTIEVVEAFSYMCPHCMNFQPHVSEWHDDLPDNVEFQRAPVVFRQSWEPYARAYYTADVLGILDQSHEALFKALHNERRPLRTLDDLAEFHAQFGVDADEFESTAKSFPVESRMRMGNASLGKWQVRSTPTLIVNGKYRVSPWRGSTFDDVLDVADYLIAREIEASGDAQQTDSESADS
jgi:thiol:disulfide interchange protein DsbA